MPEESKEKLQDSTCGEKNKKLGGMIKKWLEIGAGEVVKTSERSEKFHLYSRNRVVQVEKKPEESKEKLQDSTCGEKNKKLGGIIKKRLEIGAGEVIKTPERSEKFHLYSRKRVVQVEKMPEESKGKLQDSTCGVRK